MLPGGRGGDLIIIAAIALIVVGPKNLPKVLREVGRFVGRMRAMADDFKSSFEDMARQSELDELRKEVDALRQNQPVFDDLKGTMKSIAGDIRSGVTSPPYTPPPGAEAQMEGLPPGASVDVVPDNAPPAVTPAAEDGPAVIVKKPRARKTRSAP